MMKYLVALMLLLALVSIAIPADQVSASRGGDDSGEDDRSNHSSDDDDDDDDDDDEDEDEDENEDERDDDDEDDDDSDSSSSTTSPLEVEADVFTDTTIVKVEMRSGRKIVFATDADTRAEVIDVVVAKLGLLKADVEAVIDFEIENRASRAKERAKITGTSNIGGNSPTAPQVTDAALRERIKLLQDLVERLIALLRGLPTTPSPTTTSTSTSYTTVDVALHASRTSCWSIVNGKVYDLTTYITRHPGGDNNILRICGVDGTSAFEGQHGGSSRPENTLAGFYLAPLAR